MDTNPPRSEYLEVLMYKRVRLYVNSWISDQSVSGGVALRGILVSRRRKKTVTFHHE